MRMFGHYRLRSYIDSQTSNVQAPESSRRGQGHGLRRKQQHSHDAKRGGAHVIIETSKCTKLYTGVNHITKADIDIVPARFFVSEETGLPRDDCALPHALFRLDLC